MFKGPQFYLEEEHSIFKGRAKETNDLLYLVEHSDFSVCYAVSGEGKSSLINAGLCPKLREDAFLPIHIKNITEAEVGHFDEFIWDKVKDAINSERTKEKYSELSMLKMEPKPEDKVLYDSVWWKLRTREFRINSYDTVIPVLIFDQFEEVFSSAKDLSWTDTLFSWLESLYQDENPIAGEYSGKLQKKFKILFSLRSEYVCELDYWSMNQHFIPSLKNNRYYLKPLTKDSALEVASLLDRLPETLKSDDIIKNAKIERVGEWENIKDDLPCVSALILSLILTGLSEKDAEVESRIEDISASSSEDKGKELFDFLLDNVYKKALIKCDAVNDETVKNYIEILEDTLVDMNGRRRHVSERELPPIVDENIRDALAILEKERIINNIDHHYEISHDSLCAIMDKRKKTRQEEQNRRKIKEAEEKAEKAKKEAEETKRRENQREDLTSSLFLLALLAYVIWLLSSIFQDKETAINLRVFDTMVVCSIANLSILPFLIYSSVKKLNITPWLSVYGIISNAILMFYFLFGQTKEMELRWAIAAISIGIPTITLIYSFKFKLFIIPQTKEFRIIATSIPLLLFFWIVSSFVFYLCVFNKTLGLPEPFNSSWGIFMIPLLTHEIIRNILRQKHNTIVFCFLCCFWGILTYNTSVVPFAFPSYVVVGSLIATLLSLIWSYRSLGWWKRTITVGLEILVLNIVIILNMGFNLNKIKYDTVSHVYNWVDATVYDQTNHVGVVSACYGDTILPCAFDSINYRQHYCYISSNKFVYDRNVTDYKGLYSYNKMTGSAIWQCLFIDEADNNILKYNNSRIEIDTLREDSLRFYVARAYHDVRNANIQYFVSGKMYSLNDISPINTLISIQNRELKNILNEMYNSCSSQKSTPINISQMVAFNKAFARSFYLLMLKDRIMQKDSVNIFNLTQEILTLYFYDAGDFELTTNSYTNFNTGRFHKNDSLTIKASGLRNDNLDIWYNYVRMLLSMDMGSNVEEYANKKTSRYMDILNNLQSIHEKMNQDSNRNLQKMHKLLQKSEKLNIDDLKEALEIYKNQLNNTNVIKDQTNTQIDKIEYEKKQIDLDFQRLIDDVYTVLSHIVLNSSNIYNSAFIDICEQLYLISVFRQYEIAPIYLRYLEEMYQPKNKYFSEFRKLQEQEDSLKRIIKDFRY